MSAQKVLITGATSGIGLALSEQYTKRGDKVIACGRSQSKLASLKSNVYQTCLFDITDSEQISKAAKAVPALDVLILNAGDCLYIDSAQNFDAEIFSQIVNINLVSVGYLLQHLLPKVKSGGQVVFVSSSATILPFPRSEAYGASKAGMDYLANSLRIDLANKNIGVTLVHPGFIKTPLTDKNTFAMPFLLSSEQAAQRIIAGVNKRQNYLHFPKRLTLTLKLFSLLPLSWWQTLILRKQAV